MGFFLSFGDILFSQEESSPLRNGFRLGHRIIKYQSQDGYAIILQFSSIAFFS
jgi:hypothetical protein